MPPWLVIYLLVTNVVAFSLFGVDKSRARRGARRIPERTLLLAAAVSGTVGAWLGMRVFHHKTAKQSFVSRMALATLLDLVVAIGLIALLR